MVCLGLRVLMHNSLQLNNSYRFKTPDFPNDVRVARKARAGRKIELMTNNFNLYIDAFL